MQRKESQVNPTRLCHEKLGTLKWILLKQIDELLTPLDSKESQPNQSQFSTGDALSPSSLRSSNPVGSLLCY